MIFKISPVEDQLIEKAYQEGMGELNDFWGINWQLGTPNIFICETREDLDKVKGTATSSQTVAIARGKDISIIDFKNMATQSSLKLDQNQYSALIKHELCHLFVNNVTRGVKIPLWLAEGLSIYLSGQTNENIGIWKAPNKFASFLDSNKDNPKGSYEEGGYVVKLLVEKFGKDKMTKLIREIKEAEFASAFEKTYSFTLSYSRINELI